MTDHDPPPLESYRTYRYLRLLELVLTIAFFTASLAVMAGLR